MDRQAVLAFERAQQLEPQNPHPSLELAEFYFQKDDEENGVKCLIDAFMIDPYYPGLAKKIGTYGQRIEMPEVPSFPTPSPAERELRRLEQ